MIFVETDGLFYAEVTPAGSRWLPLPGRWCRWWYEVQRRPLEGEECGTTYAYEDGGSGGGFTFRGCVSKASTAAHDFSFAHWGETRAAAEGTAP